MKKFALIAALALVSTVAKAESPTWPQVQSACGTEYRATKGQADRKTWPDFLSECRDRKGFVPKRAARQNVTLPDVK